MRLDGLRGMTTIATVVALGSAASPRTFLRPFGIDPDEVTGAAEFGWRLFAMRTGYLGITAARGDASSQAAFLPLQLLDQAVFWHAYATRSVPRRAAVMAAGASGAIVAFDAMRRRGA